jgi:hypothetical protein
MRVTRCDEGWTHARGGGGGEGEGEGKGGLVGPYVKQSGRGRPAVGDRERDKQLKTDKQPLKEARRRAANGALKALKAIKAMIQGVRIEAIEGIIATIIATETRGCARSEVETKKKFRSCV